MTPNFDQEEVSVENSTDGAYGQELPLEEHGDERGEEDGATRDH